MSSYATAPAAPGAMGQDVSAPELLAYLEALGQWRERRRVELDQLDAAAVRVPEGDALTSDIIVSMTLWKAIADRHDQLVSAWDSGRVLEADRRRLSTLIWGRLDTDSGNVAAGSTPSAGALSLSVPEACRVSDTLASSLRAALRLDGAEPGRAARVHALRAAVERIRDQVELIPEANRSSARQVLIDLDRRVVDLTERDRRGADVGGLLGPLEAALATTERDLIVAASTRAQVANDRASATMRRAELITRAESVRALVSAAHAQVRPVPNLAVPDVTALGEIPTDAAELTSYLARLDRVSAALDQVRAAYAAALERPGELSGLARSYAAQGATVADRVVGAGQDIERLMELVREANTASTVDTDRLAALAAAVQAYVGSLTKAGSR